MVFLVIRYRCAIWTIRNGECQRIELWTVVLEKILESPLYNKEIKQSIWKEINLWPLLTQLRHLLRASRWKKKTDASTTKEPNYGSSKQIVCSSTPGGNSERLKSMCTLGPLIHALHSLQQHWRQGRGIAWRGGGGWLRDTLGPPLTNWDK